MLGKSRIQNYLILVVVFFLLFTTISSAEGVKGLSFWQTGGFCFLCVFTVCALRTSTQAQVMVNISSNLHQGSQTTHFFAPVSNVFNQMLWSYIRDAIVSFILYYLHLISQITHLFAPVSNIFHQMPWSYIRNAIVSIILYNLHLISQITLLSLFKIDTHECLLCVKHI